MADASQDSPFRECASQRSENGTMTGPFREKPLRLSPLRESRNGTQKISFRRLTGALNSQRTCIHGRPAPLRRVRAGLALFAAIPRCENLKYIQYSGVFAPCLAANGGYPPRPACEYRFLPRPPAAAVLTTVVHPEATTVPRFFSLVACSQVVVVLVYRQWALKRAVNV